MVGMFVVKRRDWFASNPSSDARAVAACISDMRPWSIGDNINLAVGQGDLAADPDLFNRWEAGQDLGRGLILARAAGQRVPLDRR